MRKLLLFAALPLFSTGLLLAQSVTLPEVSPQASVAQTIGLTEVAVSYHRPSVNKREVWGKLVPYGYTYQNFGTSHAAPWRAGANENTTVSFGDDVTIAGRPLKAGTYGLAMAIAADGTVTLIFSNDAKLWGSFFYEPGHDALRVDVKWEDAPFHEQLTYDFTDVTEDAAVLALSWEKKRIPIPLKVDTNAVVVASLKNELHNSKGFEYQAWLDASGWLLAKNLELPLALQWADTAITGEFGGERNYRTLSNKADILDKLGRADEAAALMKEALPGANVGQIHQYGRRLLARGKTAQALEVFKLNAQLHPDVWPVNYGLARGYSGVGDYKAALEALLKAQAQVPAGDTLNAEAIKANIEKVKRGENIN